MTTLEKIQTKLDNLEKRCNGQSNLITKITLEKMDLEDTRDTLMKQRYSLIHQNSMLDMQSSDLQTQVMYLRSREKEKILDCELAEKKRKIWFRIALFLFFINIFNAFIGTF